MSKPLTIKSGAAPLQFKSNLANTAMFAHVHTPGSATVNKGSCIPTNPNPVKISEYGQRVRSISNGRSPEGKKMAKYTGTFKQSETQVVPLQDSKSNLSFLITN